MTDDVAQVLTKSLVDRGLLIEAGFAGLRSACIPADAPEAQVQEMRMAFFAGAEHLFGSILSVLEPGQEPTENDLQLMTNISAELDAFAQTFKARLRPVEGA